jgi:tungstate transport system substrate-binding protein
MTSAGSSAARALALLLLGGAPLGGTIVGCGSDTTPVATIRVATTTSFNDTGVQDVLLDAFRADTGIEVRATAVGTGHALKLGERGDADVVVVHSRQAEDEFVAKGFGVERRDVWWNRFVIVGPKDDPADVRSATTAADAFQRIQARRATFVSRGDDSGTHLRQKKLWGAFERWPGYLESGQGQGPTLMIASEKRAYALTDEGTFLKMRKRLDVVALYSNGEALANPYGVIVVRKESDGEASERFDAARRFADWLTGSRARELVRTFLVDGERAFYLPGESPATR